MLARISVHTRRAIVSATRTRRCYHGTCVVREEEGGGGGGGGGKSDSLHSSDIAFKPNNDGWGGTRKVSKGWDRIFGDKAQKAGGEGAEASKSASSAARL